MDITAVSAPSATASTASSGGSKYTALLDQYAKTLAPGTNASFDDQLEAFNETFKILFKKDYNKQLGISDSPNKSDADRAQDIFRKSDIYKKAQDVAERMQKAQLSIIENGKFSSVEDLELQTLAKFSIQDQKLQFVASSNGALMPISEGAGCRSANIEFASLDDCKAFLKNRADGFARDQAKKPPAADPSADPVASAALNALGAANAPNAASDAKSKAAALLAGKASLTPTAPGMVNAAVALQVLQAAADAKEAQDAQTKGGKPHHAGDAAPGSSPTATPDPASATTAGIDKTAAQPAAQAPSITLKV